MDLDLPSEALPGGDTLLFGVALWLLCVGVVGLVIYAVLRLFPEGKTPRHETAVKGALWAGLLFLIIRLVSWFRE